ncbi:MULTISPECIES: sirohydrochlorin chelatase [Gordonia]|uniref:Cobalamin biosynthesis protein CbiX n=1 Tax=Gordonia alkanivorans CGMCC 6845 TaxID=1423140 RepID=W9DGL6_9ACTN|nr:MULTISPECIES: sirohydrochlorin chelatase [Gordonia]AZZ81652.1 sirohydrochlorin chelatase [Gordonia alkanivorans]ETA07509.1 cobalamin biosynthesis protein CbiX [Gordonia alkanivorans CGMCC 6845]MDH3008463.1 sirohydrochlorin chelatase [Gordonia alkanivorans]MDH3015607.1 sirohydrochlorin chelatase [Gordonia alkanivorans]MDH3020341.1 sirohydrochlorin chelatase [Gordonia alkanivorans]
MSPVLVLVAHGSRDPRFGATARRVRDAVAVRLPGVEVVLSYLDLDEPLVGEVLATGSETGDDPVVVPLLLSAGYHHKIDLPAIIAEHRPFAQQTDVIGTRSFTAALADRLLEAGLHERDGVILSAVGSSDESADRHVRRRAIELSTSLHRPVEVVFATKLGSGNRAVATAVRRLRAVGAERIALSPYFLSAGLLIERVESALDALADETLVAGPLGAHPDVVEGICGLYRTAAQRRTVIAGR